MNEQEKSRMFSLLERIARALENLTPVERDISPYEEWPRSITAAVKEYERTHTAEVPARSRDAVLVKQLKATPEEMQAAIERATKNVASGVIWRDPCRREAMEITSPTEGSD